MLGLVRARKVLRRRWGSAHISFGEPISLADSIGDRRAQFALEATEEDTAEKRRFVDDLAQRVVERINAATFANTTAVAACAFLGETRRGMLRHELTRRMQELVALLRLQDARLTPALLRDQPDFDDAVAFLLRSDLIEAAPDPRGEILFYEDGKRRVLDIYRNGILHFLAPPSFLARRLLAGASQDALRDDLRFWLDLFHNELFTQRPLVRAAHFEAFLDYFERLEVVERHESHWRASEKGAAYLHRLSMQTRGLVEVYAAAFSSVLSDAELGSAKNLTRRASEAFARSVLLGDVEATEVSNRATFQGALDELERRNILVRERPAGAREAVYTRGPAFGELAALVERLAGAVAGG
jgi:glycerol-3-phosphate O-acyltransferase